MAITELDPALRDTIVADARRYEPAAIAVLVTGSYARGEAALTSDLDVRAITPEPVTPDRTWFVERSDGSVLHVSLGSRRPAEWLGRGAGPAGWSLGFPAINTARYLWSEPGARGQLGDDPSVRHPAAEPELEDFIEAVMKVKAASREADVLGLRWAAQLAGELAPRLLIGLNPERRVRTRREALTAALELPHAPAEFASQIITCLGLNPAHAGEVAFATAELGARLLAFLRHHAPDVDAQPDLARYLVDGTLERHLSEPNRSDHSAGSPS